jgi:hypothetical protein
LPYSISIDGFKQHDPILVADFINVKFQSTFNLTGLVYSYAYKTCL